MNNRTHVSIFHTDVKTETTKELKFSFDKMEKTDINLDLSVCTFDTLRGKNKTDHAYMNQKTISLSGTFSERTVKEISEEFFNYRTNKLQNMQKLFNSFIQDTRLFYIYTRFKTYKNYVLKSCSFSQGSSISSINVSLSFVEIMFRNNEELYTDTLVVDFKPKIMFFPPLTDALIEREIEVSEEILPETKVIGNPELVVTYNKVSMKAKTLLSFEVLL